MKSSSSSSAATPHSSTSSTSESKQQKGFEFNGTVYPTYNEMVSAKRERNRCFLEQKLSEVASFAATASKKSDGSQYSGDGSITSAAKSASTGKKRKRSLPADKKYERSGGSFSADLPLRRNPRRSTTMSPSFSDYYDEHDDQEDQKPRASPSWTRSSSSYATPIRKRHRRVESDHANDDEKSQFSTGNSPASALLSAARVGHAKAIHVPRPRPPANRRETYRNGLKLKIPGRGSRPRGPAANNLLPKSDVKDLSSTLEHVILNGFRVRNRETAWRDFYTSGCASDHVGKKEKPTSIDFIDRELYAHLNSELDKTCENKSWGDNKSNDIMNIFNQSDDDDLIPKEYQLSHETLDLEKNCDSESCAHPEEPSQCQKNPAMKSSADVSLVQNSIGSFSKEPDRCWDQKFGDGCDPMLFVEECRGYKDEDLEYDDKTPINTSLTDGQYTATLLQRCWERAVHAVSSTVVVHLSEKQSDNSSPDEVVEIDGGDVHLTEKCAHETTASATVNESKASVTSFLHREALNVVDSVMDLLLSEKKGLFRDMINSEGCSSHRSFQWYDVFQLLQITLQPTIKNAMDQTSIDRTRHELSTHGESSTSEVLHYVDRIFHEIDLNVVSVADVFSSVSKHFGFSSIDKSTKKVIRARLLELLRGDVQAKTTSEVSSSVVEPIPARVNAYPIVNGSSYSTIQINQNRCPIPLNHVTLKAITLRLIERYGSVSHKFPS